uniref:Uncharacterized protein n=1 Tax=Spumella elongata TaxID=89044 RepID=A0A7S3HKL5_9STRA|mmetsp:Transcript_55761/g.97708  ORF Transcript_55761/g.97708 Transcript_55761/m.97708 type:complete len:504 (+) Transcript_55761:406-1917(+)
MRTTPTSQARYKMKVVCRCILIANVQSQSAPAQLLTDESEHILHTTAITNHSPPFPATLEATAKSSVKVTSTSDSEFKLFDVSSAEKRRRLNASTAREDVNAEEFDNYTTGESSLCDSSRRSLAPSRSTHRDSSSSHSYDRYEAHRSSKVSSISGDVYTDHTVHSTLARSSSRYRGRNRSRSPAKARSTSGKSRSSRSSSRSSSKGTVTSYSRHTTHTSYSYTTHRTYSSSYRHERVDTSRYSEFTETTSSAPARSYAHNARNTREYRDEVSYGYDTDGNYPRGISSSYHTDARSPSPARTAHRSPTCDAQKNSSRPDTHSNTLTTAANRAPTRDPDNYRYYRELSYRDLPLEWWERTDHCKEAKLRHTDRIDHMCGSRESLVLKTTLWKEDIVLEPNMFPYYTPYGVEHYTLWSVEDLTHEQIVSFVDRWLYRHMPHVRRWQYDDNSGERSIDLFHVHVFIETAPFQYAPREGMLYIPPHAVPPAVTAESDRQGLEDSARKE